MFLKPLLVIGALCLVASPVGAWDDDYEHWGQRYESPLNDPPFSTPTAREPVDPYDFLPRGHWESVERQYENQQYRSRYGGCANMYDNNPAAKEMCLKGLGR